MKHKNQLSLLCCLIFLSAISMGNTQCRLGTKVETAASTTPADDSGYYETSAQKLVFCTNTQEHCVTAPVAKTPALIASVMSDPIALIINTQSTGAGVLVNTNGSNKNLPIFAKDEKLGLSASSDEKELWFYNSCTVKTEVNITGTYSRYSKTQKAKNGSGASVNGSMNMQIQVFEILSGDCTLSLTEMKNCYLDPNQCGATTAAENEKLSVYCAQFFEPYLLNGAVTLEAIAQLKSLAYQVNYALE